MICEKCKNEIPEKSVFCPQCGNPVKADGEEKSLKEKKPRRKIGKKTIISIVVVVIIAAVAVFGVWFVNTPSVKYAIAEKAYASEKYEKAVKYYTELGDYEDAPKKLADATTLNHYTNGMKLFDEDKYKDAEKEFKEVEKYKDSKEMMKKCNYNLGKQYLEKKDYLKAAEAYKNAYGYEDSYDKLVEIGSQFIETKDYENAKTVFAYVEDKSYQYYVQAMIDFESEEYEKASVNFNRAGDIYDAEEKCVESQYRNAQQLVKAEKYTDAARILGSISDYEDAANMLNTCNLFVAKDYIAEGSLNKAQTILQSLPADFVSEDMSAADLNAKLTGNSAWLAVCGKWKLTSGQAKSTSVSKSSGRSQWWTADMTPDSLELDIHCGINDDGSIHVTGNGSFITITNFSTVSSLLDTEVRKFKIDQNVTSMSGIVVDEYTTMSVGGDGVTVSYQCVDENDNLYFTYTYTANCTYGNRTTSY